MHSLLLLLLCLSAQAQSPPLFVRADPIPPPQPLLFWSPLDLSPHSYPGRAPVYLLRNSPGLSLRFGDDGLSGYEIQGWEGAASALVS